MGTDFEAYSNALDTVLKNSKYNLLQGKMINIAEYIYRVIAGIIKKLFERISIQFNEGGSGQATMKIFIIAAVVILIAIIAAVLYRLAKKERSAKSVEELFNALTTKKMSMHELLEKAKKMSEKDEYRLSMHYYFAALLYILNEKNYIKYFAYKTNNQLLREVMLSNKALSEDFSYLIKNFNEAWYGYKNTDFGKWESIFHSLLVKLNEEAAK